VRDESDSLTLITYSQDLRRPTTLDLTLAAHVLLLVDAPLPDPLLSSLLSSSYPALLLHARRVLNAATPTAAVLPPGGYSLSALLPYPSLRAWWSGPRPPKSEEEKHFERMRWRWLGLAVLGSVGYWIIWGPRIQLVMVGDEEGDENLAVVVGGEGVASDSDEEDEEEDEDKDWSEDKDDDDDEGGKTESE
jgi:sorting and assembly machinery component 37